MGVSTFTATGLNIQNTQVYLLFVKLPGDMLNTNQWKGQPMVSSGLPSALPVKVSPIQCDPLYEFHFLIKAPVCTPLLMCA
jgi:hypothetical protein